MSREALITHLLELPGRIATTEGELLHVETTRAQLVAYLTSKEDELLLGGQIDGKNAELRAAQLRVATQETRDRIEQAQAAINRLKIRLHQFQNEHSSLKAIARLLAGTD